MADKKHGKVTKQLFDEIYDVYAEYPKGSTKKALLAGLLDLVDKAESDEEAQNIVWANKDLPLQMLTVDELNMMPSVSKTFTNGPSNRKVNKEEAFGEDWVNRYEQIPYNEIALVAKQHGKNPKELVAEMGAEALDKRRKAIAHGEDEGGWLESPKAFAKNLGGAAMHVFAPRQQEAIERGEEPSAKDIGLDVAQSALYAVPYGQTAKFIANPGVKTLVGGVLSNAGAPLATEALDYAAYDNNNPRGQFSVGDVATGTGVNLIGGALLRGAGMGIGRVAPKAREFLGELATGKTAKEVAGEASSKYATSLDKALSPNVSQEVRATAQEMKKLAETNPDLYAFAAGKNAPAWEIAAQDGTTAEEKVLNWLKSKGETGYNYITPGGRVIPVESVQQAANLTKANKYTPIKDSPITQEMLTNYDKLGIGTLTEGLKTTGQLAKEEALKNFITNEFGNIQDEQGRALTRFPLIGPALQKAREERLKKEAEHEENMRILEELRAKGLLRSER